MLCIYVVLAVGSFRLSDCLLVCLSVCLSVTLVYCVKMAKDVITLFS